MRPRPLFLLLVISVLAFSCGKKDSGESPDGDQQSELPVNAKLVDKIAFDFHFLFYDENMNIRELNEAEAMLYFEKGDRRREKLDPLDKNKDGPGDDKPPGDDPSIPISEDPPTTPRGRTYVDRCGGDEAQVPIPPPWGDTAWLRRLPDLPNDQIFNAPDFNPVEVWSYEEPGKGICIAIPRHQREGSGIREIGFICQNRNNGKTCFWAARPPQPCTEPFSDFEGKSVTEMCDGDTLPLNCTLCHRGRNAFIVHPGTSLEPASQDPAVRYTPISDQPDWNNTPTRLALDQAQCALCHEFGSVTESWCATVLKPALGLVDGIRQTMPPGAAFPSFDASDTDALEAYLMPLKDYSDDLKKLSDACVATCGGPDKTSSERIACLSMMWPLPILSALD